MVCIGPPDHSDQLTDYWCPGETHRTLTSGFLLLFSRSVISDFLWPQGLQHAKLPCPSPSPGACSNSYPWSQWCHPTISSSVIPFSSCPQSFPAAGSFLMSSALSIRWPKYWIFSFCISPSDECSGLNSLIDWFPGLTGLISLQSKGLSRVFSNTTVQKHQFFSSQPLVQLSHPYVTIRKTIALIRWTFIDKVMSLLFNMLSRFVIAFLPRSKCLFNFMVAVTICSDFGAQENKSLSLFLLFPHLFAMKWWDQMLWSYFFECWVLNQFFHSPL